MKRSYFAYLLLLCATSGCPSDTSPDAPDYAAAFPQGRVAELTLTISPGDWDAMLADMTTLAGEFGASTGSDGMIPGGGTTLPPELTAACLGSSAGSACSAEITGTQIAGTCTTMGADLVCQPEGTGGGIPGGGGSIPGGGGSIPGGGGADIISGTPIYVECTAASGGQRWEHVGVRFKGNSSLQSSWASGSYKLPLRLDFDHFDDLHPETHGQRFHGFEHVSLSNGWSDASLVRDKMGTDIFAEFGVPAPATAFYRVHIDHGDGPVYFGLYAAIELPSDHSFLDTTFGGHAGNLYKPEGTGATWAELDTATLGKENHVEEADFSDAEALFAALHADRSDATAWRAELERRLDVEGFLRWLALNTVIEDWDTYGNMSHNYYMYAAPNDGGRFHFIPWDHSFAFGGEAGGSRALPLDLATITDAWPLIRFLMDDPSYFARYRELVRDASAMYASAAWKARFREAHDLIASSVVGPEGETDAHTQLSSPDAFEAAHAALGAHPDARAAAVSTFLGE